MPGNDPIDLSPDSIVALLRKSDKPGLHIYGYLGEKHDGRVRLYWDLLMQSYYDIDEGDIVARMRVGDASMLVVKDTAHLKVVSSGRVDASWLEGIISGEFLQAGESFCVGLNPPTTHHTTRRRPPTTVRF